MKTLRSILLVLTLSVLATAAVALRARATPSDASCGLDYCFCMEIDCYMGDQLCASSDRWVCYQSQPR